MMKDDDTGTTNLNTIDEDEELETTQEDINQTIQSLHVEPQPTKASTHCDNNNDKKEKSSSCISFECIVKLLCEDPDKPKEGVAANYRSGLAPEHAAKMQRGGAAPQQAYRMKCLNETGRFAEMELEDEDKWKTQGLPKAYSMRASSCY